MAKATKEKCSFRKIKYRFGIEARISKVSKFTLLFQSVLFYQLAMKLFYSGLFVLFFAFSAFAQQAVVLESKSLTIPRFDDMAAINAAIPSPNAGMMVYNEQASTFIYFDGSNWISPSGSDWSFIGASIYNNNAGGAYWRPRECLG